MKNTWFDRTRMYTDPKTGHLMIVRTDEKGKDIDGSETTMRNFKNQTKQIIDRYDVEKETSSFTKTLGEDVRLALKDPNIKTIKDALQKTTIDPETGEEYTNFQLIDQWVKSITDADAASILVDELGGKYSATGDVNEKGNYHVNTLKVTELNMILQYHFKTSIANLKKNGELAEVVLTCF